jgi:hypothetical protein
MGRLERYADAERCSDGKAALRCAVHRGGMGRKFKRPGPTGNSSDGNACVELNRFAVAIQAWSLLFYNPG